MPSRPTLTALDGSPVPGWIKARFSVTDESVGDKENAGCRDQCRQRPNGANYIERDAGFEMPKTR